MAPSRRLSRGFTLLEVVVALAIVAIALGALVRSGAQRANALDRLRESTFAQLVAANVLDELRLREPFPETGKRDGQARMGLYDWTWQLTIAPTEEPDIRRLDVRVARAETPDSPVVTLAGFAGRRVLP